MRKTLFSLSLLTSLSLTSCSTILNHLPGVYHIDVQQGNIIEQSMVDQLRPGMNKRQVLFIMGSPMMDNIFHKNRWDYLYSNHPTGEDTVQKQLSLFFENDQIVGIQGDYRPGKTPALRVSNEMIVDIPKRDLDKTLWEKITGLSNIFNFMSADTATKNSKSDVKSIPNTDNLPL
jgi:outer membrane protein assembly factor BamE